jgi:hypothetical protein
MPSFKPKATKKIKICKRYSTTLDGKHKEIMTDFSKDECDIIPRLKEEKHQLLEQIYNSTVNSTSSLPIEQIMEIKDRIKEIKNTINELKSRKNNYFLDNSKYIFEYFENKKNIENTDESGETVNGSKSQMLFNFFKIQKTEKDNSLSENRNRNIVQKYLSNIDESFIDMNLFVKATDVCQSCYKGELIPLDDEGVLICNMCAVSIPYLIKNEKPTYKERS